MELLPKSHLGFYQRDLEIEYFECVDMEVNPGYSITKNMFYQILFIKSGSFKIISDSDTFIAENGAVIISKPNHCFFFDRLTPNAERLTIYFHTSLLQQFEKEDFLRVFNNTPSGTCFYPAIFKNPVCYETLCSVVDSLNDKRNKIYMSIKIQNIIAELDFKYDDMLNHETHDKYNTTLSVIEFVNNNYTKNISLETIKSKYFISYGTINRMFKREKGTTFLKYLNNLRIKNAINLLNNKNISISEAAQMSGFSTYSTFYREYIKIYGHPPAKIKTKKQTWPLDN